MADWKSALSALAGVSESTAQPEESKQIERKSRVGVVYSTNPDFVYEEETTAELATLPPQQQKLRIAMERAGRRGKTVTLVRGFVGTEVDLNTLGRLLKQKCGVGGAVKEGEIIIQGDHRQRLVDLLKKEGYTQTK